MSKNVSIISENSYTYLKNNNNTNKKGSLISNIPLLLEEQSIKYSNNIAIVHKERKITYYELNQKVNQLANYLRNNGVKSNTIVGIITCKSIDTVIGLLAIIKAGGAYLPLDNQYPEERLSYMVKNCNANIILTHQKLTNNVSLTKKIIHIDNSEIYQANSKKIDISNNPDDLLYTIYTSGSTGNPKAVGVYHRNFLNLMNWYIDEFSSTSDDSYLLLTSLSFDLTQKNIFAPLMTGGKLIIPSTDFFDPSIVLQDIFKNNVTRLNCTPSMFIRLVESNDQNNFEKLQAVTYLFLGGEPILIKPLQKWIKSDLCNAVIVNTYGPTECTDICAAYRLPNIDIEQISTIPIGKPISNCQIYILDNELNTVPVGEIGELHIGGAGIGAGYLNDITMTKSKYINNPFKKEDTIYKSGDFAKWLPNGTIEYIGRIDQQVKIRGFRIELGDIESVLSQFELITETIVVAYLNENSNFICAYYVSQNEISSEILQQYLLSKIPEYMIPKYFVYMNEFPLTPNGKIDKKALSIPDGKTIKRDTSYKPPVNPIEIVLVNIWEKTLNLDKIGINDNFFKIGGDSLTATRIVSQISKILLFNLLIEKLFENPTITELSSYIKKNKNDKLNIKSISKVVKKEKIPLSYSQQRLWFLHQLNKVSSAYNEQVVVSLIGDLNRDALEKSFTEIIQRHQVLRTVFYEIDGIPYQKIICGMNCTIEHDEIDITSDTDKETVLNQIISKEVLIPFDLTNGPLIRIKIININHNENILIITMHHIIVDGWSLNILFNELSTLYTNYCNNINYQLQDLDLQYADYAIWQREQIILENISSQFTYWQKQLSNIKPLNLPTDYPRQSVQTCNGALQSYKLSQNLSGNIKSLSNQKGVTSFMTLLTAFYILLYKYTSNQDICVGTPIANRNHWELENLIGFFVNTLVLRLQITDEPTFNQILQSVKKITLEAYNNQDLPFELLVQDLLSTRDMSHNPLFQVMFVVQNTNVTDYQFANLEVENKKIDIGIAKFDLVFEIIEDGDRFEINVEYNTDLFKKDTITRMLQHFDLLLENIVSQPDTTILKLPILSDEEQNHLLYDFNNTKVAIPKNKTIHKLFEEQVTRTPNNIAVVFENQSLTYKQLNDKANQLARTLHKKGVSNETIVGLMIGRSLEMIIGLLGILKSGGAFLPLDSGLPHERICVMLEDSDVNILVTSNEYINRSYNEVELIDINNKNIDQVSKDNCDYECNSINLAYIIYTSGSTGKPKGVLIEHISLINLCFWHNKTYIVSENDRASKYAGFGFDASVWEIFPYLVIGASVHILSSNILLDVVQINNYFEQNKITFCFLPTQICEKFITLNNNSLRYLLTGGDKLKSFVKQKYSLVNNYGPTENTVVTTYHVVDKYEKNIPIGKPIFNTNVYILDKIGNLQPIGIPGELCISGNGLARGYQNSTELVQEKFIVNPYNSNEKIYRTGDLAKWLPDGTIAFLGRIDNQVQIRGFRIEMGEIETQLLKNEKIDDCVVVAEEKDSEKILCAFYTGKYKIIVDEIRNYLKLTLPDYMIPGIFVYLTELPLSSNGKVDKKLLPEINYQIIQNDNEFKEPRNFIEQQLHDIWSSIFKIKKISILDNFFNLGGHSLKVIQMVTRIKNILNYNMSVIDFMNNPSISQQAVLIDTVKNDIDQLPGIVPITTTDGVPLSYTQRRMWFFDKLNPGNYSYRNNHSILLNGPLNISALSKAINKIICRHQILRTIIKESNGKPYQYVLNEYNYTINESKITINPETDKELYFEKIFLEEYKKPFNYDSESPYRINLYQLTKEIHILSITLHHIVYDGWSYNILLNELTFYYNKFINNIDDELEPIEIEYCDYANWQNTCIEKGIFENQIAYWKKQFSGKLPILLLPFDKYVPNKQVGRGQNKKSIIPNLLVKSIQKFCNTNNCTEFILYFTIYFILLHKYSNQNDIIVGTPVSGRNFIEIEKLIGFFANTIACRAKVNQSITFLDFLTEVKHVVFHAIDNQDVPFDKIVEVINPSRIETENPVFRTMFSFEDFNEKIKLDGLISKNISLPVTSNIFDLSLSVKNSNNHYYSSINYNSDLFNDETIDNMINHYESIISDVISNPEINIVDITIFSTSEKNINYSKIERNNNMISNEIKKTENKKGSDMLEKKDKIINMKFDDIAKRKSRLSSAKLKMLKDRIKGKINQNTIKKKDSSYDSHGPFPLSFPQQRLWFLENFEPDTNLYNVPLVLKITGKLDKQVFNKSITEIVRRHEVLRTVFPSQKGDPVQIIRPIDEFAVNSIILNEDKEDVYRLIQNEIELPFDLFNGPLFRVTIFILNQNEHFIVLNMHHIISDGWSISVLYKELNILYNSYIIGNESELSPLSIQYSDFAIWQRDRLKGEVLETHLSYWREQLKDSVVLELPIDYPRPSVLTYSGGTIKKMLPVSLSDACKKICSNEGTTLFMFMLSAFYILLHRYCGQNDISVGSPIANRNQSEIEELIGFFINTLVLRTKIDGNNSFMKLLQEVKSLTLDAYEHQDLPFEKIVEELQPTRDMSHNPFFQVLFVMQNNPKSEIEFKDLEVKKEHVTLDISKFDLSLAVTEKDNGLEVEFEYNNNLFQTETINRMISHFELLLASIISNPNQEIYSLNIVNEDERNMIIYDWNDTDVLYEKNICIHQLFERQVELAPESIALICDEKQMTYKELNIKANQLANELRNIGLQRGDFVTILIDRSFEMIIGVLGILKAGGAYIPIEPSVPDNRIEIIVNSLDMRYYITNSNNIKKITRITCNNNATISIVSLDSDVGSTAFEGDLPYNIQIIGRDDIEKNCDDNVIAISKPDDIAYIIFTSGTTGDPKGVVVKHKPVINLIEWVNKSFSINQKDRLLFITSLSFDLSVYDIFGILASGASIRLVSSDDIKEPQKLIDIINNEDITFWDSAPAPLQLMLPFCNNLNNKLRLVFLSGDWINISTPDLLNQYYPGAELISLGGATEATVWSNYYPVKELESHWVSIPYGKPIQNASYYILDHSLHVTPIGVPGDLYIGGECLSSGYINDLELTNSKFIKNPFILGTKMYKTGDLARWFSDGNIEFLGRKDFQVKIRGYRIELGEIESVLLKYKTINDVVVTAKGDLRGDKMLVAYIVKNDSDQITSNEIRDYVKENLPEYMVPSHFVFIDKLPLNVNGKIDRKSLPEPDLTNKNNDFEAPRNNLELILVEIWTNILEINEISINDNFFEIGGHSLLATRAISQINDIFQVECKVKDIFEFPTVRLLIDRIIEINSDQEYFEHLSKMMDLVEEESSN